MSPEMAAMVQAMRQWLAQAGLPPSQVAEMVFDAIRQEKFYILTHPTTKQGVQLRMEDILQERMPTDIFQAGSETAIPVERWLTGLPVRRVPARQEIGQ